MLTQPPLHEALLLISICLFLVFFAWLRNRVQAWLTHAIFRRGSVAGLASRVKDCPAFSNEDQYMDWAAALIAAAVKTKDYKIVPQSEFEAAADLHAPVLANMLPASRLAAKWNWAEVVVPVRRGHDDVQLILLGRRHGGQRYFSEDLDTLRRAAVEIAERVEALRRQEMNRLVSQAELRALQSQINPHFLFNALNTLYGTIPREAVGARRMVINLADIFRYFLQSDKSFVPLAQEMQIVRAYLEVEQLRLGDRLAIEFQVNESALGPAGPRALRATAGGECNQARDRAERGGRVRACADRIARRGTPHRRGKQQWEHSHCGRLRNRHRVAECTAAFGDLLRTGCHSPIGTRSAKDHCRNLHPPRRGNSRSAITGLVRLAQPPVAASGSAFPRQKSGRARRGRGGPTQNRNSPGAPRIAPAAARNTSRRRVKR